jgi:hypothetical protein
MDIIEKISGDSGPMYGNGTENCELAALRAEVAALEEENRQLRNLQSIVNRDGGQGSLQEAIDKAGQYKFYEDRCKALEAGLREIRGIAVCCVDPSDLARIRSIARALLEPQ